MFSNFILFNTTPNVISRVDGIEGCGLWVVCVWEGGGALTWDFVQGHFHLVNGVFCDLGHDLSTSLGGLHDEEGLFGSEGSLLEALKCFGGHCCLHGGGDKKTQLFVCLGFPFGHFFQVESNTNCVLLQEFSGISFCTHLWEKLCTRCAKSMHKRHGVMGPKILKF